MDGSTDLREAVSFFPFFLYFCLVVTGRGYCFDPRCAGHPRVVWVHPLFFFPVYILKLKAYSVVVFGIRAVFGYTLYNGFFFLCIYLNYKHSL
jgi:hypothetical protein